MNPYLKPDDVNKSVSDLMTQLYGGVKPYSVPPVQPQNMSVAPGTMSVAPNTAAPRYSPVPAQRTTGTAISAPTSMGTASQNINLQGRAYYENLVAVGNPAEKQAGLIWLRNNPIQQTSTGFKTGDTTETTDTTGSQTGETPVITPTETIGLPQNYTRTPSAQDIIDQGYQIPIPIPEPNPDEIYAAQLKRVQSEIDSANQLYNDMLVSSRARLAPVQKARTQQGFISNVRGGTIGSGFDTGLNESINTANQAETQAEEAIINEKRAQALAGIMGVARKSAETELTYQREQKSKNADAILNEIKTRPERKKAALSPVVLDMIAKGIDIANMTPEALNDLAKSFGKLNVSTADITSAYKTAQASQSAAETEVAKDKAGLAKTEAETKKILQEMEQGKWQSVGDGSMIVNIKTGERIINPKTFAPSETDTKQTKEQIAQTIYKQMATPEWKNKPTGMKKQEFRQKQKDYILSLGADPADYGLE